MEDKSRPFEEIPAEDLRDIIDNLHDEIMVYDDDYNLVYVNKACERHYGLTQEELAGSRFNDLDNTYWGNSTLPEVYEKKTLVAKRQFTNNGSDIITISVPLLDDEGNIRYVVQNVNDIYMFNELGTAEESFLNVENADEGLQEYVYSSRIMAELMDTARKISSVDSPCLILGETGNGKTLLARQIHKMSPRKSSPFIAVNCACMNPNLIESELFGYEKGAFSGARQDGKKGIVEAADGGTLLLDEISEIPLNLQSKLLQFIQEQEFTPLGSAQLKKVDVRIIAASNRNLQEMVKVGSFREDLYYRLNTFELTVPPLRKRKEDIRTLANYYLSKYNTKYGREHVFSDSALRQMMNYRWPGNIRELSHTVEKLVVLTEEYVIMPENLPACIYDISEPQASIADSELSLAAAISQVEKRMVEQAYKKTGTSTGTAELLGVSQPKAYRLIQKYCK